MSNTQKAGAHLLGTALIQSLGLPENTTKLSLHLEAGKAPILEIEHLPTESQMQSASNALQTFAGWFELREITQPEQS